MTHTVFFSLKLIAVKEQISTIRELTIGSDKCIFTMKLLFLYAYFLLGHYFTYEGKVNVKLLMLSQYV